MCWWRVQHVWGTLAAKTSGEEREKKKKRRRLEETSSRLSDNAYILCMDFPTAQTAQFGFLQSSKVSPCIQFSSGYVGSCHHRPTPPFVPAPQTLCTCVGLWIYFFVLSTSHLYINELCSPTVRASVRRLDDDEEWDYPSLRFRSCHPSVSQSFVVVICHH